MNNEPVAIRYDFDGYGYQYMDSGSGSDWQTRVKGEFVYSEAFVRQQQAEIEALKQIIDANNLNQKIGQFVKPINEPVAWMHTTICSWVSTFIHPETQPEEWIPLYTHPVKDLEDIDINITWNENSMRDFGKDELAFARAILLKAQE